MIFLVCVCVWGGGNWVHSVCNAATLGCVEPKQCERVSKQSSGLEHAAPNSCQSALFSRHSLARRLLPCEAHQRHGRAGHLDRGIVRFPTDTVKNGFINLCDLMNRCDTFVALALWFQGGCMMKTILYYYWGVETCVGLCELCMLLWRLGLRMSSGSLFTWRLFFCAKIIFQYKK